MIVLNMFEDNIIPELHVNTGFKQKLYSGEMKAIVSASEKTVLKIFSDDQAALRMLRNY